MTTTPNFGFVLPDVGGSKDQWGTMLNTIFTSVDTILFANVRSINHRVFQTNSTYTKPSNLVFAKISVVGGGGGGGGPAAATAAHFRVGGGGGAGGYAESWLLAALIGATESVSVGAAGSGGFNGAVGGNGGTSSFGSLVSASGGAGGNFGTADDTPTNGNGGGGTVTGQLVMAGGDGNHGFASSISALGGLGGSSFYGGGGQGAFGVSTPGQTGKGFGAGGGGGASLGATTVTGGLGKAGVVIVVEFLSS